MTPRDNDPDRLALPADLETLLALAADDIDDADRAAGQRIAERLLGARPATVTPLGRHPVLRVPGWTVQPLAAAADDLASPVSQQRVDPELGLEFTRAPAGSGLTRIAVQATGGRAAAGDVVRVAVGGGTARTELLVVLYTDDEGTLTGQVLTPAVSMAEDLEISVLPGAALGTVATEAVTDAVRCSLTAGRNAWRRVAKGLPADDPIRSAIVAGLR